MTTRISGIYYSILHMLKQKSDRPALIALILMAIAIAIPFILLSGYVFPVNDDFSFALNHTGSSALVATIESWHTWSGRYTGTFISSLNPLVVSDNPLALFPVYSATAVGVTLLAFLVCAMLAFSPRLGFLRSAASGALLFALYITLCPSIAQEFYWFSSITCYTLPTILLLLFLSLQRFSKGPALYVAAFAAAMLAFLLPGCNEVTAVLFVTTVAYMAYIQRSPRFFIYLAVAVAGILLVISSPGNSVRMTAQLSAHPYLWSLAVSLFQTIVWAFLWLPTLLLATLIWLPLCGLRLAALPIFRVRLRDFIIFAVVAVFLSHIPPTLGLSSIMTDRTANALLPFYILFYFWGVSIWASSRREKIRAFFEGDFMKRRGVKLAFFYSFFAVTLLSPEGNVAEACADLFSGEAAGYHSRQLHRLDVARSEARPDTLITLPALEYYPGSIYVNDLPADSASTFNRDYQHVFGIAGPVRGDGVQPRFPTVYQSLRDAGKRRRK